MPEAQRGKIHLFSKVGFMHQREIPLLPSSGTPTPPATAFNAQILRIWRLAKYHPFKKICSAKERERDRACRKKRSAEFSLSLQRCMFEKKGQRPIQSLLQLCTYTGCVRKKKKSQETREESRPSRRLCFVGSSGMDLLSPSFLLLHLS